MNIVLLQGPLGPFFQSVSHVLEAQGHTVFKVAFNGGDERWSGAATVVKYRGNAKGWRSYFADLCCENNIDAVVCYGDCRFYHKVAASVCREIDTPFWALEEGYLRPDFVTLELGGVNANSPLYPVRNQLAQFTPDAFFKPSFIAGKTFKKRAWYASFHHISRALLRGRYPHYVNHRPWTLIKESSSWLRGGWIKLTHKRRDRRLLQQLQQYKGRLFLLPLQVSEDFQIRDHSKFNDINHVIDDVIRSFAEHALKEDHLLIKHHPMDRGYLDYQQCIDTLIEKYHLQGRVFYGYELPLPKVYPLLKGVVTVNSTVGLSALLHDIPVKCLGKALYDIPRLTTMAPLSNFWRQPVPVCSTTFNLVHEAILHQSQINGNYYTQTHHTAALVAARVTGVVTVDLPPASVRKKKMAPLSSTTSADYQGEAILPVTK